MATDPKEIQLTEEQRAKLAERAELTGKPWQQLLNEMFANLPRSYRVPTGKRSLLEVLQERGMIGGMKGPGDLSTNPKHMEGFGEPRYPKDSD